MNAKPVTPAAKGGNQRGADGSSSGASTVLETPMSFWEPDGSTSMGARESARAVTATRRLMRQASQSVSRLPKTSMRRKFAERVPKTAPSVFTP